MSGNGRISMETLMEYLSALGVDYPSNPAGAMTGAEIITALNTTLGYSFWVQGIQSAIYVNDWSQDSTDLASYIGIDGKWHFPNGSIIVTNTDYGVAASRAGRNIVADGNLYIIPSACGGSKGITLLTATGIGDCLLECSNSSAAIIIGDVAILGNDNVRPVFNITAASQVLYHCTQFGAINPGTINATTIDLECQILALFQTQLIVGVACDRINLASFSTYHGAFSCLVGFDMTSTPTSGLRVISVENVECAAANPGEGFFNIDTDNGVNQGVFTNCILVPGFGGFIHAASDVPFNTNPLNSVNFEFNVRNFGNTQRIGEQYFHGSQNIVITLTNTYYDLFAAAIQDGGLSNGIVPTVNPGEFVYNLPYPSTVQILYTVQGSPSFGSDRFALGAFYKPAAGAYAQVTKGIANYVIEDTDDPSTVANELHFSVQYSLRMSTGDTFKAMVKNKDGTQDFTLTDFACIATVTSQ